MGGTNIKPKGSGSGDLTYYPGLWKLDFERKLDSSSGKNKFYVANSAYGSYTSIYGSSKITPMTNGTYEYMKNANATLKKAYYVALGRERWGSYNVNNTNFEIYYTTENEYFLKDYK